MGVRTEVAADHDDWPDDEVARLRGGVIAARETLPQVLRWLDRLPSGHPARRHAIQNLAHWCGVLAYSRRRLMALGLPLPTERSVP